MKKIFSIVTATLITILTKAQGNIPSQNANIDYSVLKVCVALSVAFLFMVFILTLLKRIFEYRLKNKIIDKGIPENIASSANQRHTDEESIIAVKWFAILTGIGVGLTVIYYTQPLGLHSLAIMAFSIALSFL